MAYSLYERMRRLNSAAVVSRIFTKIYHMRLFERDNVITASRGQKCVSLYGTATSSIWHVYTQSPRLYCGCFCVQCILNSSSLHLLRAYCVVWLLSGDSNTERREPQITPGDVGGNDTRQQRQVASQRCGTARDHGCRMVA